MYPITDYLCNVLDDLGLHASDTMKNLATLMKANPENYSEAMEKMPQRLVSAVAEMRHIKLD
jgi:hypothetical protein